MTLATRVAASSVGLLALTIGGVGAAATGLPTTAETGPNTTVPPYVLPVAPGVQVTSLLTVDDQPAGNGVHMVGIPDGMGIQADDDRVVALMNHELRSTEGPIHAHGQTGAFVSRNVIDPATGAVLETTDLVRSVRYWDYATGTWVAAPTGGATAAFNRFCSGAVTEPDQLYDAESATGYRGQVYFGNEENGDIGRDFGITMDGVATQLPRMGLYSYENTLVAHTTGRATVVIGTEDGVAGDNGQLRIYVGQKQATGTPIERAGLANGTLHVLDAADPSITTDTAWRAEYPTRTAHPATVNEVDWNKSAAAQNADAAAQGLSLNRIEDGAFDPRNPNDFYFLTTEGGDRHPLPAQAPRAATAAGCGDCGSPTSTTPPRE